MAEHSVRDDPSGSALTRARSAAVAKSTEAPPARLSPWVRPLVWLHRRLSPKSADHAEWKERIEAIEHAQDVDAEPSTEGKAILADRKAWQQMKQTGLVASAGGLGVASVWMGAFLLPWYAFGHGFGWVATALLLPVPIAWRVGRRMWERAALEGMKDLGPNPTPQQQNRALALGMSRGMVAGAATGFTLVFLQGLVSWFMTPAPTLALELIVDLYWASGAGVIGAAVGAMFGPLVARGAPTSASSVPSQRYLPEPDPK